MALTYDETSLWKRSLGQSDLDPQEQAAVERLRGTFATARDRIKPIVRQAHLDCAGLTIHDETHLDALWQMANIIIGDDHPFNPLEAFIFGCSVLFHDSALSVCAYEGGLDGIKETAEWCRAIDQLAGRDSLADSNLSVEQARQIERMALFATLRALHAQQAAVVAEREWVNPESKASLFIIEDTGLRDYYGQLIGRLAYSHHWDIDRVSREFSVERAPPPDLPAAWTINELKVACMLRCADAAHIDQRRAPLMERAISAPTGVSASHWLFQARLGVPISGDRSLIYNSGRDFGRSEADAWWLCYDTCRMISDELQNSNAVLKENGCPLFFAGRVEGAQRPKLFAKYVKCDGWEPVDAEVRVTDPIHLAETLGGKNLYGRGVEAPVRELLQNAIDATLLRKSIGRDGYIPNVRLTVWRESDGGVWISVEDNGIGMSERVLTRRLLDFGRSGWKSDDVAQDNPELRSSSVPVSGKFGIGFFAVFLVGDDVTVVTRRHKDGVTNGLALEFVGLSRRPILRKATQDEQSDTFTTRVIIRASDSSIRDLLPRDTKGKIRNIRRAMDFFEYLKWLLVSCSVDVEVDDKIGDRSFKQSGNWATRSPEEFLRALLPPPRVDEGSEDPSVYGPLLSEIMDEAGSPVGLAAVRMGGSSYSLGSYSFARVGGLTYPVEVGNRVGEDSTSVVPPYVGIMPGDVGIATRGHANVSVTALSLSEWATDQARLAESLSLSTLEKLKVARRVYWAGGDTGNLPIAILGGKLASVDKIKKRLYEYGSLFLPVVLNAQGEIKWVNIGELRARSLIDKVEGDVCYASVGDQELAMGRRRIDGVELKIDIGASLDEELMKYFLRGSFDTIFDIIEKSGRSVSLRLERKPVFLAGLAVPRSQPGFSLVLE